jgi:dolichol-phosphate mannosyltransferase
MNNEARMTQTPSNPDSTAVTILVPTLNEFENIDPLVERILSSTAGLEFSVEILIVDGGSKDGTRDKVREWAGKGPVSLFESDGKGGLSGDIMQGAAAARTDVVVVMDADLSHPPEALPSLIRPLLTGTHDMAIGSRYIPGGATPNWPWIRRLTSRTATHLAWPLISVHDPMSGFFAVRRERLLSLGSEATGFKIALEVAARGDDELRVIEVPIVFVDRQRGTSKFGSAEIFTCLKQMMLLAGGSVSAGNAWRFAAVGAMGVVVDYIIFSVLLSLHAGIVVSHTVSFFAATIFNYILNARWAFSNAARQSGEPLWSLYLSFLAVCVMALLLRGSVLAILTESVGWSPRIAIFFAIAAAALVNFVGTAFFVFPRRIGRTTQAIRWRVFALALLAYAVAVRLGFMGVVDLLPEEAYYWSYAQHPALGYLDHPPMVAWLIWLGTHVLGNREIGVRLPALLCWLVMAFFMYRLGRDLFGKTAGFLSILFLTVLPIYFSTGFFMMPDAPFYAAWTACLYYLQRGLLGRSREAWLGVGISLGLGLLSKYTMVLLVPAAFLFMLLDREARRWLMRPEPYAALCLGLALFLPVLYWNFYNGWASFAFQGPRRFSGEIEFSLHVLVGGACLLLTPLGLAAVLALFVPRWLPRWAEGQPLLRQRLFSLLFALTPLAVFFVHSLQKPPKLNWTGPVWLSLIPLLAIVLFPGGRAVSGWLTRVNVKVWRAVTPILLILYGTVLYALSTGLAGLPPIEGMKVPMAWEEFGREADAVRADVRTSSGTEPLVVGMDLYGIAAELSFYTRRACDECITGRHLFNRRSLMWERWFPASRAQGRTVLLVDLSPEELSSLEVSRRLTDPGPVMRREIRKGGSIVGHLFYRVGHNFRSEPPSR